MLDKKLKKLSGVLPIIFDNETCVYCGIRLTPELDTKEHVIGRRFVPKGKLDGQWNLIVRACKDCNSKKSDLENDISAISMQTDAWGNYSSSDQVLTEEATRKARNSISRRTGKPVKDSSEKLKIKVPFTPGVEFTFNLTSPPQIENHRIYKLARLQLMAFFYWITYNKKTKKGGFWIGGFFPVLDAIRSDWGNPIHIAFMNSVVNWEPRVLAIGADGFFKVVIRRHPSAVCWSWAVEWNQKYRVVGFFGEKKPAQEVARSFPSLEVSTIPQGPNKHVSFRMECPLEEEKDNLFQWD